jgi:hypothetical protein
MLVSGMTLAASAALIAVATPVADDIIRLNHAAARTAFAEGKKRAAADPTGDKGDRPLEAEQFMICAAYWDAYAFSRGGALLTPQFFMALGPELENADGHALREHYIALTGANSVSGAAQVRQIVEEESLWADNALNRALEGNAEETWDFFVLLGACYVEGVR